VDTQIRSERDARKRLIDPKLAALGWQVVPFDPGRPLASYDRQAIEEYPTTDGPADYALTVGGQILGIVEAKKLTLGPQNASVGRVAILPVEAGECILGTSVTYYRCRPDVLLPQYCSLAMQGSYWQDQLRLVMEQTTRNQVSILKQAEFWLPIPPIAEQHEIVRRVEALFTLADAIEARVAAVTACVDRLTQAILAKAFRGELVPTEAELARREGREYESAAKLRERTRAERATRIPATSPQSPRGNRSAQPKLFS